MKPEEHYKELKQIVTRNRTDKDYIRKLFFYAVAIEKTMYRKRADEMRKKEQNGASRMIIDFEQEYFPDIEKQRTDEFLNIARRLSALIGGLNLSPHDNNRLVDTIIEQVEEAEQGAFEQGFKIGYDFGQEEAAKPKKYQS